MLCSHFASHISIVLPIVRPLMNWLISYVPPASKWRSHLGKVIQTVVDLNRAARRELAQDAKLNPKSFILRDGRHFKRGPIDYVAERLAEGELSREDYNNSTAFLFESSDKTSFDAIIEILYHLGRDPSIQSKLRNSI